MIGNLFTQPVQVQPGDLWQLGQHRLKCGDCTEPDDVARLFAGARFALCFTSPPYSDQREYKIGSFDWHALMCGSFDQMVRHGTPDGHILINLGLSHKNRQVNLYWLQWLLYCERVQWPVFGWYVWDKGTAKPCANNGRLTTVHEFIFHFSHQSNPANKWIPTLGSKSRGIKFQRERDGTLVTARSPHLLGQPFKVPQSVLRINPELARGIHTTNHPAVFPVALPEFIMQTWSQPRDIVYEPFCGSGTSILAGEHLGRRVYAMEIEPTYCELAIQRWQEMTGQQAQLKEKDAVRAETTPCFEKAEEG